MRFFKIISISGLALLFGFLLSVTGAYLFVSDETLFPLLSDYLESATGTQISYNEDAKITRTLTPTLHLNNLVIEDEAKDFSAQLSSLKLQLKLPSLLSGKLEVPFLTLGDTRLEIKQSDSTEPIPLPDKLPLLPVLDDIQVSKLTINLEGEDVVLPVADLQDLSASFNPETDTFIALADIDLAENKVHLKVEFPRLNKSLETKQLPFAASAKSYEIDLATEGSINFRPSSPMLDASVRLQAPNLTRTVTGIEDFVLQGSLEGKATLAGTFDQLAAKDISAIWQSPQRSVIAVNGSVDNVMQVKGCELRVDSHLEAVPWLAPVLPESLGPLHSADVSAKLSCADQRLNIRDFSLQAKTTDKLDLSLVGQLDLVTKKQGGIVPEGIDLKLKFSAPTTRTARVLFFDDIWEFGPIRGTGDIRSAKGVPSIENISILAKDPQGLEVTLKGGIAQLQLFSDESNSGYNLDVTMSSDETATMMERLGVDLSVPGPLSVSYKIEGASQSLQLNKIKFQAGKEEQVQLFSDGSLLFGNWSLENPLVNIDLNIQANSNDTPTLETFLGLSLPDFGPLTGKALLHTVAGKQRIDDFQLQTVAGAPLQVSLQGSAAHSDFFIQPGISGIQLKADVSAEDTASLNRLFGLQNQIPTIGPLKASAEIAGDDRKLVVDNFAASAGTEEILQLNLNGKPGVFAAATDWRPKGTDLGISAQATDSRPFFDLLGFSLPGLGNIVAHAGLKEEKDKLLLESISVVLGEADNPSVAVNGQVADLIAFAGIDFDLKLNLEADKFVGMVDDIELPEIQPLTGELAISDSDGTLGIDRFFLKSLDDELLSIDSSGHFEDFNDPETLAVTTHIKARDLLLLGALFDFEWPAVGPVELNSKIRPVGDHMAFDTALTAGELKLDSEISGLFHTDPPQFSGKITAQNFFLPSLIKSTADADDEDGSPQTKIFSAEPIDFSWLNKVDLDLSVAIESYDAERSQVQSSQFEILVQSGVLKVTPAKLQYAVGELDLDIELDARQKPTLSFEAYGKDLNPWYALDMKDSRSNKELDAELDVEIEVTSSGGSEKELAANLQGLLYMNLKNGKMRRALLDLIFLDFAGWTLSKVTADKYADVQCGVADFSITDGVIKTNGLFVDAKAISIVGEGTIDLAQEEIDYVLLPKKKSRLIKRADPVKLRGPLNDPSVTTVPLKTAITTYGSLFFAPYLFVGIYAADMVADMAKIGGDSSPCLEYERKHSLETQGDKEK